MTTFFLVPFQNKLLSLCILSTGGFTYLQSTTKFELFKLMGFTKTAYLNLSNGVTPLFSLLIYIKALTRVSLLELYPGSGVQYARSPGVSARFIKLNLSNHLALVELPSGVRKFFSLYSTAFIGGISLKNKSSLSNTKSGFWRTFGFKSKVRGVAMNPVDHPHGGRTKAIKNPRTPWGRPTKLK